MQNDSRAVTSLSSNDNRIELSYISRINDNYSIRSNQSYSRGKSNSIKNYFQKIIKKLDCLHLEKRGIERVSPEDRTDPTIINTAMIWVTNLLLV